VRAVEGEFERGDPVTIRGLDGAALGAALVGYGAAEARLIAGRRSGEIEALLGYPGRAAMAHRDDMTLWSG
jgi:glutamate 5-kinase